MAPTKDPEGSRKRDLAGSLIDSRATPSQSKAIIDVLEAFPVEFLQIASESGGKIRPLAERERYADASAVLRRLSAGVDDWPVPPAGLFVVEDNTMYLRSVDPMTIAHEFGHLLDLSLGNGAYRSGTDSKIRREFESAVAFVTPYSASGLDEFFAESVRSYVGINSGTSLWPKVSPERLQAIAPGMSALLDSTVDNLRAQFVERAQNEPTDQQLSPRISNRSEIESPSSEATRSNRAGAPGEAQPPREKPDKPKRDYRQEITDKMIAALENGTAPWQKGWDAGEITTPYNPTTNKPYRGGNTFRLMLEGHADPRWMTKKQAEEKGWEVKPGSGKLSAWVEYWDFSQSSSPPKGAQPTVAPDGIASPPSSDPTAPTKSDEEGKAETNEAPQRSRRPRVFYSIVYNAEQIEGIPPIERKAQSWEAVGVWATVKELLTNAGIEIKHDGEGQAFFRFSDPNAIHLPEERLFHSEVDLASTALHEGVHWSGHQERMQRHDQPGSGVFGSQAYAREELIAEMGAAMIAANLGIPREMDNNAAYVKNWVSKLKDDKNEIFRAASEAQRATDFIFDRALERLQEVTRENPPEISAETSTALDVPSDDARMAIDIAINSLPVFTPRPTDIVQQREDQSLGLDQRLKIVGRSPDGERVFGNAGGSILSLSREDFAAAPKTGKTMTVSRVDGRDIVQTAERELALER